MLYIMKMKGIVFLREWYDTIVTLDPQDQADILALMFADDEQDIVATPVARAVFGMIRPALERQRTKYEQVSEKRKAAVKKRWDKGKEVQADTNEYKCIQMNTNVMTCKQDKNKDKDKNKNKSSNKIDDNNALSCECVRDLYNEICTDLPKCSVLSEQRKKHIRARCQMLQTENDWRNLFRQVQSSDFLTGRSGSWRASFDWLVQSETNCTKVIEGNYTNTQKQTNSGIVDYSRMKISENKYTMF